MGRPRRPGRERRPRGEANEAVAALERLAAMDGRRPDVVAAKRDAFARLIRHMTAGIDVSSAFVPATKCAALSRHDLPLKKMLYLYLRSAARANEATALLVVQAMLNDARDPDPSVRGLAVRSMASLRVPALMDAVFGAVAAGLADAHPHVREAAVLGALRCAHQDAAGTRLRGLLDAVRRLLAEDPDPQVVANCLHVMRELGALEGLVSRPLVVSLLNHLRAFSEWAQCLVLDVVATCYAPASDAERFDVLEVCDFGLSHANSAVVLATAKLFLRYTAGHPAAQAQALAALRAPLQALVAGGREPEVAAAALSNFLVLARRHRGAFAGLHPDFYARHDDPPYLKALKIEMLVAVADASSAYEIAEELSAYARGADEALAAAAVAAVGRVAVGAPEVDGIVDRLLTFLAPGAAPHVAAEALRQMTRVLRRYPDAAEACVDAVAAARPADVAEPSARAALVWVLGEFGGRVQDAPYVLEALADGFAGEAPEVRLALLSAVCRLFLSGRAPECRPALAKALAAARADADADVRDAGALALRLLRAGPAHAAAVLAAPRPAMAGGFADEAPPEVQDRIYEEFNTLSTVYNAPAATFVDAGAAAGERFDADSIGGAESGGGDDDDDDDGAAHHTASLLDLEDAGAAGAGGGGSNGGSGAATPQGSFAGGPSPLDLLGDLMGGGAGALAASPPPMAAPPPPAAPPAAPPPAALSGLDDFLAGFGAAPAAAPAPAAAAAPAAGVSLSASPVISAAEFQALWARLPQRAFDEALSPAQVSAVEANRFRDFVQHVAQANVRQFATPREGSAPPLRFLFHAQANGSGAHVLVQVTVARAPQPAAAVVIKAEDAGAAAHVEELLRTLLVTL